VSRFILYRLLVAVALVHPGALAELRAEEPPVIVIDPGHGGSAVAGSLDQRSNSSPNNATSPSGLREKDLTLDLATRVESAILEQGKTRPKKVGVLLTRSTDTNLDFVQRAGIAARYNTACIVSIHFNASSSHAAKGTLSLIAARERNKQYDLDLQFATGLTSATSKVVREIVPGSRDRGVMTDSHLHNGLGSNFFFQLARHKKLDGVPRCFLEVEFMDNPEVEKHLLAGDRDAHFDRIAAAIAGYLLDYVIDRR